MNTSFSQLDNGDLVTHPEIKGIIELLGHCKAGNFNIHISALFGYFICSRREIRFYLFGKGLISSLSCANMHAFYENHDRI